MQLPGMPSDGLLNNRETLNHWLTRDFDPSPDSGAMQRRSKGFIQVRVHEGPGYYMGAGQDETTRAARYENTRSPGPIVPAPPCPCIRCF